MPLINGKLSECVIIIELCVSHLGRLGPWIAECVCVSVYHCVCRAPVFMWHVCVEHKVTRKLDLHFKCYVELNVNILRQYYGYFMHDSIIS